MGSEINQPVLPYTDVAGFEDATGKAQTLKGRAAADGLALPTTAQVLAVLLSYNGTTLDLRRNNLEGTLLASAARTADAVSPDQVNHNARGLYLFLDVTVASGTGGVQAVIQAKDPISGQYVNLLVGASLTTTGLRTYVLYPGIGAASAGVTGIESRVLPRTWRGRVAHSDASSYTYSLGYALIL